MLWRRAAGLQTPRRSSQQLFCVCCVCCAGDEYEQLAEDDPAEDHHAQGNGAQFEIPSDDGQDYGEVEVIEDDS